jgi:hypothetical protein
MALHSESLASKFCSENLLNIYQLFPLAAFTFIHVPKGIKTELLIMNVDTVS